MTSARWPVGWHGSLAWGTRTVRERAGGCSGPAGWETPPVELAELVSELAVVQTGRPRMSSLEWLGCRRGRRQVDLVPRWETASVAAAAASVAEAAGAAAVVAVAERSRLAAAAAEESCEPGGKNPCRSRTCPEWQP